MKNIFKIHPFFYLFALLCIFTGYFKDFLFITSIVLFHELGHIITSFFFKWKIDRVLILPFGCLTIFNELINRPMIEEFLITIMGPFMQIILFLFDKNLLFQKYNLYLLIFNLIPIFPLDGSKLLNLFFNKIFAFKISHIFSIFVSIILIFFLLFLKFNLVFAIILLFLAIKTYKELKNHPFLFNKFLFERYIYKFKFKKMKKISHYKLMKRDYRHIIKSNSKYLTEYEYLSKLFDN